MVGWRGGELGELFSELRVIQGLLVYERHDILTLGVHRPREANSLVASIEYSVVAVEEVQAKDPVANLRTVHQS